MSGPSRTRRDVAEQDRCAVLVHPHGDLRNIRHGFDVAAAADHVFGSSELDHPAPHVVVAHANLLNDLGSARLYARSLVGFRLTWYCRTKPPTLATSATPSTLRNQ